MIQGVSSSSRNLVHQTVSQASHSLVAPSSQAVATTFYPPDDDFYKTRLGKIMDKAEPYIVVLIIINAIMMGVGTFDFVTENKVVEDVFERIDKVFLIIFTIELALNLIDHFNFDRLQVGATGIRVKFDSPLAQRLDEYERKKRQGWVAFDAVIVLTSWAFSDLSVFRGFRILRALRLVTKFAMFRNLVKSLINVSSKVRNYYDKIS
jgi:hypothetical protein